jgi:pimeloyl-ACP methyl ester carboxylesterase
MIKLPTIKADFLEAGSGPVVMLVHSSVSGARMWRRLMDDLKDDFYVRAVNLYGYGPTPPWSGDAPQTLDDQARLVETALPTNADHVSLVGHSFGGSVAMKLAARLSGRITKLVLLRDEPILPPRTSGPGGRIRRGHGPAQLRQEIRSTRQMGNGRRTIRRLLGRRRVMGEYACGTAQHFCGGAEAKLFRVGRGDGRNHTGGSMGTPAPPFHSPRKRPEHGIAHPRNHGASAPILP